MVAGMSLESTSGREYLGSRGNKGENNKKEASRERELRE